MAKKGLKGLKTKAWNLFSIYIRLRDSNSEGYGKCCTCGKHLHWTEGDAGHYVPRGYLPTLFEESNVHLQCRWENRYRNGAPASYALFIKEKYGEGEIERLVDLKNKPVKYTQVYYQELIKELKEKIEVLKGEKACEK